MKLTITPKTIDKYIATFQQYIDNARKSHETIPRVNAMALQIRLDKLERAKSTGALVVTIEFHEKRTQKLVRELIPSAVIDISQSKNKAA